MRPTAGLVSRGGVYAGWPQVAGSLGPMARTVEDLVALLDVLVGYDPEDPITAHGAAHIGESYKRFLDPNGLQGTRTRAYGLLKVRAPLPADTPSLM